jgi:hypothetical protein
MRSPLLNSELSNVLIPKSDECTPRYRNRSCLQMSILFWMIGTPKKILRTRHTYIIYISDVIKVTAMSSYAQAKGT